MTTALMLILKEQTLPTKTLKSFSNYEFSLSTGEIALKGTSVSCEEEEN